MARGLRPTSGIFGDKALADISDDEIRALVTHRVAEHQHLDFKVEFDHSRPEAVQKLLRHVASFANGGGGYLVLGIRDDGRGHAQRFEGLTGNVQSTLRSIRDMCLKHLAPRVIGLEIDHRSVDGHVVVLVRVPRSARVPHMMTLDDATEFWSRYGDRKVQMTREEIREAFQANPPTVPRRALQPRRRATLLRNGGFERDLGGWVRACSKTCRTSDCSPRSTVLCHSAEQWRAGLQTNARPAAAAARSVWNTRATPRRMCSRR